MPLASTPPLTKYPTLSPEDKAKIQQHVDALHLVLRGQGDAAFAFYLGILPAGDLNGVAQLSAWSNIITHEAKRTFVHHLYANEDYCCKQAELPLAMPLVLPKDAAS